MRDIDVLEGVDFSTISTEERIKRIRSITEFSREGQIVSHNVSMFVVQAVETGLNPTAIFRREAIEMASRFVQWALDNPDKVDHDLMMMEQGQAPIEGIPSRVRESTIGFMPTKPLVN